MTTTVPVETIFKQLAQAVQTGDMAAFRALLRDASDTSQLELFERNSAMLKKGNMSLVLRAVEPHPAAAIVHFAVVGADGKDVESGEMTFMFRDGTWFVDEL